MSGIKNILFTNNKYIVRFAQSKDDLKAAQRLRYNVFNIELGEGFERSQEFGLDTDDYDKQCHHLLVISKQTDTVIGTYRMQTYSAAKSANGFYTAEEFDISAIPNMVLNESVEVGRACIDPEHRNGRVLFLLWRGLAKYLVEHDKRYLFGCCSLTSQSPEEAWTVMTYLKMKNHIHETFMVGTTNDFVCKKVETNNERVQIVSLPQLFRLYMDLGAKVCSKPALDREFKTIDYLVLLDVEMLDEHARILFFN